jgi:putative GTP pyrophosphokinase
MSQESILKEYSEIKDRCDSLRIKLEVLLKEIFSDSVYNIHQITSRTKSVQSLAGKLAKKENYTNITDITDLIAFRVITYFGDKTENIVSVIEREFSIDKSKSVDKRPIQGSREFGYVSVHKICSLSRLRKKLPEWKIFPDIKFEIQIRDILQHTWAEIEHDIGYKSSSRINPPEMNRRFAGLSALLEIADREFIALRDLIAFESERAVASMNEEVDQAIDSITLSQYFREHADYARVENAVCNILNGEISAPYDVSDVIEKILPKLKIKTLKELNSLVLRYEKAILYRAKSVSLEIGYKNNNEASVLSLVLGISFLYLYQVIVALNEDPSNYSVVMKSVGISITELTEEKFRKSLLELRKFVLDNGI